MTEYKLCQKCNEPLPAHRRKYCSTTCSKKAARERQNQKDTPRVTQPSATHWQKEQVRAFLRGKEIDKVNSWYDLDTYKLLFWNVDLPRDHELSGPRDWKEWMKNGHEIEPMEHEQ